MTQKELISAVAEDVNKKEKYQDKKVSKELVDDVTKSFLTVVTDTVAKGDKVQLAGFGTFELSERSAREGRNPSTGEPMHIAASKTCKFKAAKAFKDILN